MTSPAARPEGTRDEVVRRDDAYWDEVARATVTGTPSILLGTSTRSLRKNLERLRQAAAERTAVMDAGDAGHDQSRDYLGRRVRQVWDAWAREQPDVAEHPSWTTSWSGLDERDREVDRRIGEALFRAGWEAREIAARAQEVP